MDLELLIALGCIALIINIFGTIITTVVGVIAIWNS